jgi:hypothetical protein
VEPGRHLPKLGIGRRDAGVVSTLAGRTGGNESAGGREARRAYSNRAEGEGKALGVKLDKSHLLRFTLVIGSNSVG